VQGEESVSRGVREMGAGGDRRGAGGECGRETVVAGRGGLSRLRGTRKDDVWREER